jgi:hypothetical protein
MEEHFTTDFYQQTGMKICPNGDQVRSDDQGLFCMIGGDRVPYPIVEPEPEPEPEPKGRSKKKQLELPESTEAA